MVNQANSAEKKKRKKKSCTTVSDVSWKKEGRNTLSEREREREVMMEKYLALGHEE